MILSFSSRYRYFIYKSDCDMRKGFDGLSGLVESHFNLDPLSGDVFLFFNRPRNRIKILVWQGDGFLICHKRLEKGTFELPVGSLSNEITAQQVQFILEGIQLSTIPHYTLYTVILKESCGFGCGEIRKFLIDSVSSTESPNPQKASDKGSKGPMKINHLLKAAPPYQALAEDCRLLVRE